MITVSAEEMRSAVKLCCGATSPNNPAPILQHLKLQTNEKRLRISGTNMIQSITVEIDCETKKPIAACVNAARLSGILDSASGNIVIASGADTNIGVSFGKTQIKLASLPVNVFPELSFLRDNEKEFSVNAKDMIKLFVAASLAAAKDDTRAYLNGIFLGLGHIVATNGHWLFAAKTPFADGLDNIRAIIPITAVKSIVALANVNANKNLLVKINNRFVEIDNGGSTILSNLVDGKYPDFNKILSKINKERTSVRVKSADVLMATRHIRPSLDKKTSMKTPMRISVKDNELSLSLLDGNQLGGEETIGLDGDNDGKSANDAVNIAYLMDAVNALGGEEIELSFGERGSPIKMSTPNDDRVVIIMPMRF